MARGRGKKSTYDKVRELDEAFAESVMSMDKEALEKKLSDLAKYNVELQEAKKADVDLQKLREQLTVASAGYRESLNGNKLKQKFIVETLKSRGL